MKRVFLLWSLLLLAGAWQAGAQTNNPIDAERAQTWEPEIKSFEQADRKVPPAKGAVLFVGSSSIRFWSSLQEDFPQTFAINRGFGGSHLADVNHFINRIVIPYRPRMIVLYAGDNDIASGKSAVRVLKDFKEFVGRVHRQQSETRIAFISIKPSPARLKFTGEIKKANKLLQAYTATDRRLAYIDVFSPMLGADDKPRPELYVADGLHLSEAGYKLWREAITPYIR